MVAIHHQTRERGTKKIDTETNHILITTLATAVPTHIGSQRVTDPVHVLTRKAGDHTIKTTRRTGPTPKPTETDHFLILIRIDPSLTLTNPIRSPILREDPTPKA